MSNLRKHQRTNYTMISNEVVCDTNLSFRARGIAAYLLSKPDDWVIRLDHLAQSGSEGKAAIRSAMQELAVAGYLKRERINGERGLVATVTHLADYPAFADDGTPESRINGYEASPRDSDGESPTPPPPETDMPETDMPETDTSVFRTSDDRSSETCEVIINTDLPTTDLPITEDKECSSAGADGPAAPPDADEDFDAIFGKGTTSFDAPPDAIRAKPARWDIPLGQMPPHQAMFVAVLDAIGWDRKTLSERDKGRVAQVCAALREAGYEYQDVGEFMTRVWFRDWQWEKNQSRPSLNQLRRDIGKVRAGIPVDLPRRDDSKVAKTMAAFDEFEAMLAERRSP